MSGKAFADFLENLKKTRTWTRARAALRRSLAFPLGAYQPATTYVEPFLSSAYAEPFPCSSEDEEKKWLREAHYLVAALYALKDGDHREGRTLARALWETVQERDSASVERRFLALLDADRDQIAFRLRRVVGLVKGGLDFAKLLDDLHSWFDPKREVQACWAMEFYGALGTEEVTA